MEITVGKSFVNASVVVAISENTMVGSSVVIVSSMVVRSGAARASNGRRVSRNFIFTNSF